MFYCNYTCKFLYNIYKSLANKCGFTIPSNKCHLESVHKIQYVRLENVALYRYSIESFHLQDLQFMDATECKVEVNSGKACLICTLNSDPLPGLFFDVDP